MSKKPFGVLQTSSDGGRPPEQVQGARTRKSSRTLDTICWKQPRTSQASQSQQSRKRRAARHASPGSLTAGEFAALCDSYGNRCLACGDTEAALEADHVVPLTRGGSDDIDNIQPMCGSCNRKKFVSIIDYRLKADGLL